MLLLGEVVVPRGKRGTSRYKVERDDRGVIVVKQWVEPHEADKFDYAFMKYVKVMRNGHWRTVWRGVERKRILEALGAQEATTTPRLVSNDT